MTTTPGAPAIPHSPITEIPIETSSVEEPQTPLTPEQELAEDELLYMITVYFYCEAAKIAQELLVKIDPSLVVTKTSSFISPSGKSTSPTASSLHKIPGEEVLDPEEEKALKEMGAIPADGEEPPVEDKIDSTKVDSVDPADEEMDPNIDPIIT